MTRAGPGRAGPRLGRQPRADAPLLRGWLHVGAFVGWLIGGPVPHRGGPRRRGKAALSVYVLGMLAMFGTSAAFHRVRWSAAGVAPHAAGRPQRDLHRHRRHVHRGGRPGPHRLGPGAAPRPGLGRRGGGHHLAPGLARRAPVGGRPALRRGRLVPARGGAAARARPGLGRFRPHARWRARRTRRARWSTPASVPTPGRGCSASTRSSTPALWWARDSSPTSWPSSPCRATERPRHRRRVRRAGPASGDDAGTRAVRPTRRRDQTELGAEDVVGVLAEPRHPGLGAFGDVGELHRETRDEHGLLDAVGARVLDEHVAAGQVRIGHDVGVGGHGPRHQAGCVQRVAGRRAWSARRPRTRWPGGCRSRGGRASPGAWRSAGRRPTRGARWPGRGPATGAAAAPGA